MKAQEEWLIRPYREDDFPAIHELNKQEQWSNLAAKEQELKQAWDNSAVAVVAEMDGQPIGYLRGLTDGFVSLYICELLVNQNHRKSGVGEKPDGPCPQPVSENPNGIVGERHIP